MEREQLTRPPLLKRPTRPLPCVIFIGMAACGKSTVAQALARELDWPYMDSDHLIESLYGRRLQDVTDAYGKETFLDIECSVICSVRANRTVVATGGSVVYREDAMQHLKSLGTIVYLDVPLPIISERIARNPDRGLAIAPGQTLADIFAEREALYRQWADICLVPEGMSAQNCARWVRDHLPPSCFVHE